MFTPYVRFLLSFVFVYPVYAEPLNQSQVFYSGNGFEDARFIVDSASSADGNFVYALSSTGSRIVTYSRDQNRQLQLIDTIIGDQDTGEGVRSPADIIVSPDDQHVYVLGVKPDDVTPSLYVYERNQNSGLLTEIQAYRSRGLNLEARVIMSDDGLYLYITSVNSRSVTVLARSANGLVDEVQFITDVSRGLSGNEDRTHSLVLSPDQNHLYVGFSNGSFLNRGAITHFLRDPNSGVLTYANQVDSTQPGLENLATPMGLAISPDGHSLYSVGSFDGIFEFSIANNGALAFERIATIDQPDGNINRLFILNNLTFSNNGHLAYATDTISDALLVFHREQASGALQFLGAEVHGQDGVVDLRQNYPVTLSPDNKSAYVGSAFAFTVFDIAANLSLQSTANISAPIPITANQQSIDIELVLSIQNLGPATAHHIRYTADLEPGFVIRGVDAFLPSTQCGVNGLLVECQVEMLMPNAVEDITLLLTQPLALPLQIESSVTMDEVDTDLTNNVLVDTFSTDSAAQPEAPDENDESRNADPDGGSADNSGGDSGGSSGGTLSVYFWLTLVALGVLRRKPLNPMRTSK